MRILSGICLSIVLAAASAQAQTQADPEAKTDTPAVSDTATETVSVAPKPLPPLNSAIKTELLTVASSAQSRSQKTRLEAIDGEYQKAEYAPIWFDGDQINKKAVAALESLISAKNDGLHIPHYQVDQLLAFQDDGTKEKRADFEIAMTRSLIAFGQHMNAGRLNPRKVNREIVIYPKQISADVLISNFRKTTNIKAYLRLLAPLTPRYERLRTALAAYRRIEANGGWEELPKGEVLKPGMEDERLPILINRLKQGGDLKSDVQPTGNVYSEPVVEAVKKFQQRHGLEEDGVIGPATLAQFNISVTDRIKTMEVNMERNRWMQNDFGPYHVFANLADQVIKLVRNGKTIHAEIIQVGKPYHRTPVFSDTMEYLELNPYWNVPSSIAVNEYLPKLRNDPGYLHRANLQVLRGGKVISTWSVPWSSYGKGRFPVRLRQPPGAKNALGRVKFMFPNQYNVYIHDTPSKSKFNRASRYFSHGCLRLRDPLKMAEMILGPQGWTRAKIDNVVKSGKRRVVKLDTQIPVHVVYLTSWVNKDGSVHFRKDVYGRDKILAKALEKIRA